MNFKKKHKRYNSCEDSQEVGALMIRKEQLYDKNNSPMK